LTGCGQWRRGVVLIAPTTLREQNGKAEKAGGQTVRNERESSDMRLRRIRVVSGIADYGWQSPEFETPATTQDAGRMRDTAVRTAQGMAPSVFSAEEG